MGFLSYFLFYLHVNFYHHDLNVNALVMKIFSEVFSRRGVINIIKPRLFILF